MPLTATKTGIAFFTGRLFRGSLAGPLVLLAFGSSGMALRAQTIAIKLVNGRSGQPLARTCVNIWIGKKQKAAMAIPTDKDGIASFRLTDKDAEINNQERWKGCGYFGVVNPVVKYAETIGVNAGFVSCQPRPPDYSWLAVMTFSTKEVLQSGIVTANACGKVSASPKPGQIILFVRPLSWWEKLKQ